MLLRKVSRLLCPLAIMALLAVSCGAEATIDSGTDAVTADATDRRSDAIEPTAVPPTADAEPTAVPAAAEPEPTAEAADDAESEDTTTEDAAAAAQDATEASDDVVLDDRDDAVDFIISEGFIASDAECIVDGAYLVFGTWDFAELDTNAEQDEQLEVLLDGCITVVPGPAAGSPPPGTDFDLDALWVACDAGSATACDDLYWDAPIDSDYESFGLTCGGRAIAECSELLGDDSGDTAIEIDSPPAGSPAPGTDAELDALWNSCNDGSATACDDLFWQAPIDSVYEAYGLSCGGRTDGGFCSDIMDG